MNDPEFLTEVAEILVSYVEPDVDLQNTINMLQIPERYRATLEEMFE